MPERMPRKYEYLATDGSERLQIDAPCEVRLFWHGRRARVEVVGWLKEPMLTKKVDAESIGGDTDGIT